MTFIKRILIPLCTAAVGIVLIVPHVSLGQNEKKLNNQPAKTELLDQNQGPENSAEKGNVIGHLQYRDKVVTIVRGSKGSTYTIQTKNGKTVAANLSEKDLKEKYPAIFNQVKYGLAGNDATLHGVSVPLREKEGTVYQTLPRESEKNIERK